MIQILVILGILFILFNLLFFVVSQQTIAIIERFGRFSKLAHAGLNFKIPFIDNIAGFVNLKIRELTLLVETKTLDNVFVKLVISVQYQAIEDKCFEAFYKLENHTAQIQSFVFDAIRAKVPAILLDDLFSKKDEIAVDVKKELHDTMIDFGYEIIKTLVTDIQPDEHVKHAMNEINTAQRLRMAATQKAEAEKIMRVKQAEAESESNILHGIGIAGQRKAIIDGLGRSVEELQKNAPELRSEKIMQMIMLIQYFDMMRDIGGNSKSNAVFLSHLPGNISELTKQLQEILPTTGKEI